MKPYLYEMHCHCKETSMCSQIAAADLVRHYKKLGFAGVVTTDPPFFHMDHPLPAEEWENCVSRSLKGYEAAKAEGERIGLSVFFAWEYGNMGNDILTYGLNAEALLNHQELFTADFRGYCELAKELGAYLVHAHPFRQVPCIRLLPEQVDMVEVFNARRRELDNSSALWYAGAYGKGKFAGSDFHSRQSVLGVIATDEKIRDLPHLLSVLRSGAYELVRLEVDPEQETVLRAEVIG